MQVFDVQRKITYKNLTNWYRELREYRPEIPCIVVANKIDGTLSCLTECHFYGTGNFKKPLWGIFWMFEYPSYKFPLEQNVMYLDLGMSKYMAS